MSVVTGAVSVEGLEHSDWRSPIHDLGIPFAMPKADRALGRDIHAGSSCGHPLSLESD